MLLTNSRVDTDLQRKHDLWTLWYISQNVGNCHNSPRVVLGECQSLTSALTSERGLFDRECQAVWNCRLSMPPVFVTVTSWVLLCWAAVTRRASSGDRSAVIQLHTEKLDWHFLLLCYILHAKHSSALSELRRWAWTEVLCFCGQDNGPCLQSFR